MQMKILAVMTFAALSAIGEVVIWPAAVGTTNQDPAYAYAVTVNGRPVDVMAIPKSTKLSEDKSYPYAYAMFDADEEVQIEITSPMNLKSIRVLPRRNGMRDVKIGKEVFAFRAKPPFHLVFEPLTTRHRALVLTAGLPERNAPRPGDPNVVYYGPGRHRLEKKLEIASGQTLYLAPGAWLEGAVRAKGENITICGRGVISGYPWPHRTGPAHDMLNVSGTNVVVRDITLTGSWFYTFALERVTKGLVDNVKVISGRCVNDDGIDPIEVRDITIRNSFIRTHDDCIAPKDWIDGLTVERCCLWADGANPIRLGFECSGGPTKPFRRIRFSDIEILHQSLCNDRPPDAYWCEAAIAIQASNGMTFEDIVFENFNFDFFPQAMDLLLHVRTLPCQNGSPMPHKEGGHVRNVTLRNFTLPPRRPLGSFGIWLQAVDSEHYISGVHFENMRNFEVPVGMRGRVENVTGLPPNGLIRDERGTYRDFEAWQPYKTRVACIGDSITYGTGLENRARDSYPAQLQKLLDAKFPGKYEVRNFGNPGRGVYTNRLFKGTNRAFSRQSEHAAALAWHPDVVICNLGINDGGEICKEADGRLEKGLFEREYLKLLGEYRKLTTHPRIIVWSKLSPLGRNHGFYGQPGVEALNAAVSRVAAAEGIEGLDMAAPLAKDIETLVLKDGIHLNTEGCRKVAEATCAAMLAN